MKKRILTLFLSIVMVFTMAVPSFAATSSTKQYTYRPAVLVMGDSVAAGCKSINEYKTYDEFKTMMGSGVRTPLQKHFEMNLVTHAFPYLVSKSIGANMKNSVNASHPGLRAQDYCHSLGLPDKLNPDYKNEDPEGWTEAVVNDYSSKVIKYAIKNSDVIIVELGGNEISTFSGGDLMKLIRAITSVMTSVSKLDTDNIKLETLLKVVQKMKNGGQVDIGEFVAAVKELKNVSVNVTPIIKEIVNALNNTIIKAGVHFRYYWNTLMNYIDKNKKDGAMVIATTVPNPVSGLESLFAWIEEGMGPISIGGMTLNYDNLNKIVNVFVRDMNRYIYTKGLKYHYAVANIGDVQLNNLGEDVEQSFIHPNAAGHKQITEDILKVYYKNIKAYLPKTTYKPMCKHTRIRTSGLGDVKVVEEIRKNENGEEYYSYEVTYKYTRDKVCRDCGKIIKAGKYYEINTKQGEVVDWSGRWNNDQSQNDNSKPEVIEEPQTPVEEEQQATEPVEKPEEVVTPAEEVVEQTVEANPDAA